MRYVAKAVQFLTQSDSLFGSYWWLGEVGVRGEWLRIAIGEPRHVTTLQSMCFSSPNLGKRLSKVHRQSLASLDKIQQRKGKLQSIDEAG